MHDVSDVFNTSYVPPDTLSKELFEQKQAFVYAICNKVILTDIGKTIVRKYENDFDAQSVYKELVEYATKSTAAADIVIDNLAKQIHAMILDSRWSGSIEGLF